MIEKVEKKEWVCIEVPFQGVALYGPSEPEDGSRVTNSDYVTALEQRLKDAVEALKKAQKELRRLNCDAPLELTIETGKVCLEIDKALKELGIEV